MLNLPEGGSGVLPNHYLARAIEAGVIDAGRFKIPTENIQPASLDLRLGEVAYRIRCSFLPGSDDVETRLKDLTIDRLDLAGTGSCSRRTGPTSSLSRRSWPCRTECGPRRTPRARPGDWTSSPGHNRPQPPLRRDRRRLRGAPLPGSRAPVVHRPGPGGPDPEPAAPIGRAQRAHRRRGSGLPPITTASLRRGGAGAERPDHRVKWAVSELGPQG